MKRRPDEAVMKPGRVLQVQGDLPGLARLINRTADRVTRGGLLALLAFAVAWNKGSIVL